MIGETPTACGSSKRWPLAEKYGSYCRTGLPLLLTMVLPLAIQRMVFLAASGSDSALIFLTKVWPAPSEYSTDTSIGIFLSGVLGASPSCSSRMMLQAPAAVAPQAIP